MIDQTPILQQLGRGITCMIWAAYAVPWIHILWEMFPEIWQFANAVMGSWNGLLFFAVVGVLDFVWGDGTMPATQEQEVCDV